jgi:formylmethanofuran dehydrogenase subunit E
MDGEQAASVSAAWPGNGEARPVVGDRARRGTVPPPVHSLGWRRPRSKVTGSQALVQMTEELTSRVATDYDAPRRGEVDELNEDSLEELKARRAEAQSGSIDVDEAELAESLELPGADLSSVSGEELTVRVLPKQDDEFTCSSCFLVHHRSRLAREKNGQLICRDCA